MLKIPCLISSCSRFPCSVCGTYSANPIGPSMVLLHFEQVSCRYLVVMVSHFVNSLPILLLPIGNLLDAMMTEPWKELYWISLMNMDGIANLMHHPTFLPLWIILIIYYFRILTTFANFLSLVFDVVDLSPIGDFLDANDGERELAEHLWWPSYTCLRHILSTLPLSVSLTSVAIPLNAPFADSFLRVEFSTCQPCRHMWDNDNLRGANEEKWELLNILDDQIQATHVWGTFWALWLCLLHLAVYMVRCFLRLSTFYVVNLSRIFDTPKGILLDGDDEKVLWPELHWRILAWSEPPFKQCVIACFFPLPIPLRYPFSMHLSLISRLQSPRFNISSTLAFEGNLLGGNDEKLAWAELHWRNSACSEPLF